eukprot:3087045-Rhodomonas_salina.2
MAKSNASPQPGTPLPYLPTRVLWTAQYSHTTRCYSPTRVLLQYSPSIPAYPLSVYLPMDVLLLARYKPSVSAYPSVSDYERAMQCPVLTWRMVLPGWYPRATAPLQQLPLSHVRSFSAQ